MALRPFSSPHGSESKNSLDDGHSLADFRFEKDSSKAIQKDHLGGDRPTSSKAVIITVTVISVRPGTSDNQEHRYRVKLEDEIGALRARHNAQGEGFTLWRLR